MRRVQQGHIPPLPSQGLLQAEEQPGPWLHPCQLGGLQAGHAGAAESPPSRRKPQPLSGVSLLLCFSKFRLSYYPHRLEAFTELLKSAFQGQCQHSVLGDFQPYQPGQAYTPCYFIHVVKKTG